MNAKSKCLLTVDIYVEIDTEHWPPHSDVHSWEHTEALAEMVLALIGKGEGEIDVWLSGVRLKFDKETVMEHLSNRWNVHQYLDTMHFKLFELLEDMKTSAFTPKEMKRLTALIKERDAYMNGALDKGSS